MIMQNFDEYLKERFRDKNKTTAFIDTALEEYFADLNKDLFLAILKEVIKIHGGIAEISKQTYN